MLDKKLLRYRARILSKKEGIGFEKACEKLNDELSPIFNISIEQYEKLQCCPSCGVSVKGKNLAEHMKKHSSMPKIRLGKESLYSQHKQEKMKLSKLAGKPKTKIISGGAPGLGKTK